MKGRYTEVHEKRRCLIDMVVNSFVTPPEEETEEDPGHDYSTRLTKPMRRSVGRLSMLHSEFVQQNGLAIAAVGGPSVLCRWIPNSGSERRQQDHLCCHRYMSAHSSMSHHEQFSTPPVGSMRSLHGNLRFHALSGVVCPFPTLLVVEDMLPWSAALECQVPSLCSARVRAALCRDPVCWDQGGLP